MYSLSRRLRSQPFSLFSASVVRASPGKLNPRGEDACFLSEDKLSFGVADGVGAWKQLNIDSGMYSREV